MISYIFLDELLRFEFSLNFKVRNRRLIKNVLATLRMSDLLRIRTVATNITQSVEKL